MSRNHHFKKYLDLRKKHPQFFYYSFDYHFQEEEFVLEFHFSIGQAYHFHPKHIIQLPKQLKWKTLDKQELDQLVFHLGMVEVVSYWKASCSPELIIKAFKLNAAQIEWWKKLYFEGLGEFFYLNSIETKLSDFMTISCESEREIKAFHHHIDDTQVMVPVGGGKDSVVSLELIKEMKKEVIPMVVNPRGATIETIENAGFKVAESVITKRSIDPQLLVLNQKGYLNGHTPFSAMLAFLSLLSSRLLGIKYVALSNESSANESTVEGTNINHQYSKSYEFESDFRSYYQAYLNPNQEYFSFLRPLSEMQIASLFSGFTQHHLSFKSCNVGSKENKWCGHCSKCLFTYILLSPFIEQARLREIFGKELLSDVTLKPILSELRGQADTKPFECVGTVSEVELSLRHAKAGFFKEALMQDITPSGTTDDLLKALSEWNEVHALPVEFECVLRQKTKDLSTDILKD